ncbi:MAG TPA: aminotransferase class III-fold pyridoxal phosphate-dependent enzyme, partial [Dissulfuribacter thermophilus]|nr:aminotransferase class III-fold pyridoxal phosphate-dependent enzyme [Dissulfuribacter thermophilus]
MDEKNIRHLLKIDRDLIWHPYTQMKDFEVMDPLFVERGEGVFLFDVYGRTYYDTISSWWCITHGHNHPYIVDAIKQQLGRLDQVHFAGTTHEPAIRAAQLLIEALPKGLDKVFFSDNGSTAVEVALKMAVQYWHLTGKPEKNTFLSLERGYHGDTLGTMGLGGVP